MSNNINRLAIVVPCFNEEDVLPSTIKILESLLQDIISTKLVDSKSFIMFVDDGSTDNTWKIIMQNSNDNIHGLKLSKNFGHQNALLAGLSNVINNCDFSISLDADLQQDPTVISKMIQLHMEGNEIIFGVRNNRPGESLFKKTTGNIYKKIINILGGNLIEGHADFRLMGKKSLITLMSYRENNIFLRGIIPQFGFKSAIVKFDQKKRIAGKSKYSLFKMFQLAYGGFAGLTIAPLRILVIFGSFSFFLSFCYVGYVLYIKYIVAKAVPGWASIVLPIWIFSSIQLLSIGLLGEYLSRIFIDIKQRPRFIIEDEVN